ncbi:MAG TPA: sigma-54-dependent Fis family transcriptional regulator [Candidatus Hydrogenedentes bacterium]|nr:sigma-54-dependent Fis family transcriptional regulator [Candidatus Hydrogenedentota bacterium]
MKCSILVTEDDQVQRDILADILSDADYSVSTADSGVTALAQLEADTFDLLLTDMRMPEMDGLQLLQESKRLRPETEVVVMTAHASVETAVRAMKEGATDYLSKPFDKDELLMVIERVLEKHDLKLQNEQLRKLVHDTVALGNIIGNSDAMQQVFDIMRRALPLTTTVLIRGESGTGKEMVARHIHFNGPREDKPFVVVNCAAIPDTLVESELFGHEKGAFTGADTSRKGKFALADGGTIFLDEIGDMPLESQAKLLRVLQDGIVEPIGASSTIQVDVRVIAATNRDLQKRVASGEFREDLFYRLDVLNIALPALRERASDLSLLIQHFRDKLGGKTGKPAPEVSMDALLMFENYRWPGNVRELENTLEQIFVLTDAATIAVGQLPEKFAQSSADYGDIVLPAGGVHLEDLEEDLMRQALERSGGRIKEAAELLGLTYKTFQYRLKKHDIQKKVEFD